MVGIELGLVVFKTNALFTVLFLQPHHPPLLRDRISAFNVSIFFLPGLPVNTWLRDDLQTGMSEGNVRRIILHTAFQLVTLFSPSFLTPGL